MSSQRALDVAGVERRDDVRQLARRAELLDQRVGAGWGEQLVEERSTTDAGDRAPANSATTRPSRNAFTAGMPLTPNRCERAGLASTSTLTSSTAPARASTAASSTGASAWHGAAPLGPEVDEHRARRATARSRRPRTSPR